jgi:acetyltransferase-like isoleucine patch superfamily enzyme
MNNNLLFNRVLHLLPNFLYPIKPFLIKKMLKKVGSNFKMSPDCLFLNPDKLEIGNDVYINRNFYCSAEEGVIIGDRVMFGANCSILGGDHIYNKPTENMRFTRLLGDNRKIVIENDAWIGHGTIILKKGFISEGTIFYLIPFMQANQPGLLSPGSKPFKI